MRADADQNADLYWAARGAGPGFPGVVTRFHLQTYAVAAGDVAGHLDLPAGRRATAACAGCTRCCPASTVASSR